MMLQFLVGMLVSGTNIGLHALVTVVAVTIARSAGLRHAKRPRLHLMGVMIAAAVVLMIAHMLEIMMWAATYTLVGATADKDLLYFAFVNYTTLGYGDITPVRKWQLIGPLTAMNGVLLFGWSAAILFEVLRKTLERLALTEPPGASLPRI